MHARRISPITHVHVHYQCSHLYNARMGSKGYCSCMGLFVCLCVSVSVCLTSGASVCPEIDVMYTMGDEGKKNWGFSLKPLYFGDMYQIM